LTAAITKVLQKHNPNIVFRSFDFDRQRSGREGARHHDRNGARRVRDGEPALTRTSTARPRGLHQEHDHGRGADGWRDLVVAATDGPMPQTREHVLLARQVGVPLHCRCAE